MNNPVYIYKMDQVSIVGIGTRYILHGPGNECSWRQVISLPSSPARAPTQLPVKWVPGLFSGVKYSGHGVGHPLLFSVQIKETPTPCPELHSLLYDKLYLLCLCKPFPLVVMKVTDT